MPPAVFRLFGLAITQASAFLASAITLTPGQVSAHPIRVACVSPYSFAPRPTHGKVSTGGSDGAGGGSELSGSSDWSGLVWTGLVWSGLVWSVLKRPSDVLGTVLRTVLRTPPELSS